MKNGSYIYIKWDKFKPRKLIFTKKRGDYKGPKIANSFISLDTETSKIEDNNLGWMYQWCFSYPAGNNSRYLVYGRKPSELAEALIKVVSVNGMNTDTKKLLPVYIHNLSYDYFYIKDYLKLFFRASFTEELVDENTSMLAVAPKKLLEWKIMGLDFKCSYRLSQKSLDEWSSGLNTKHKKLVGTIDYNKMRYQDSPLTKKDWRYMFYDVITLDEAVVAQMAKFKDSLKTIPLTMTGYVRRESRREFRNTEGARKQFEKQALSLHVYNLLRHGEYAGGLTHGNRFLAGKTIRPECGIGHGDFVSFYPSEQIEGKAPIGKFYLEYSYSSSHSMSLKELKALADKKCVLAVIIISDLDLKEGITLPYVQSSKVKQGALEALDLIEDNGRVIKMNKGSTRLVVNEYDMKWLIKQYKFNYLIEEVYCAPRGPFPEFLRNTVKRFFREKSLYKQQEKDLIKQGYSEYDDIVLKKHEDLMISKGLLNGIYGMTSTAPVRDEFIEREDGLWETRRKKGEEAEEVLNKFYKSKNSFMNYELGCWLTSICRSKLMDFVELVGYDNFLYADTDSIFYIKAPGVEERLKKKNEEMMQDNIEHDYYIEVDGKREFFNQFEDEKEDIRSFRFLHSKCYAYETMEQDGKLHLHTTIAGVKKVGRGKKTRVQELGSIDELRAGKVFTACGGTGSLYVNGKPDIININGHETEIASSVIIKNVTKTLSDSMTIGDFGDILDIRKE